MPSSRPLVLVVLLFASILGACAPGTDDQPTVTTRADTPALEQRRELNEAYSLLYEQARGLARMKWMVRFKKQSEATRETVLAATSYYGELASELERLSVEYPALNVEVPAMLPIHRRAREAIIERQIDSAMPLVGDTGREYERGVLMAMRMALDEQRNVAALIVEREPEAALRGFMQVQRQELDTLYRRFDVQLREHFFR